jgi:hypothetical protein
MVPRHSLCNFRLQTLSLLFPPSFLRCWGGVWLSPLGTLATNWPIVPALNDRWWVWSSWWNKNWHGKLKYSEKTCPSAILSTTNPTWPVLGSNPGRHNGKLATNHWAVARPLSFLVQVTPEGREEDFHVLCHPQVIVNGWMGPSDATKHFRWDVCMP